LRATTTARLLIVGQTPAVLTHESGIPWNDPSGDRLRQWMGIDRASAGQEKKPSPMSSIVAVDEVKRLFK
jgi:uracil-DNA glycosylase